jgi:hypothetical protein
MPKHESYEELLTCITEYTRHFIYERIKALRSHATQRLKLPFETFRIFPADEEQDSKIPETLQAAFKKSVMDYKLHFSSNITELNNRIETNFFSLCDSVISQTKANEKTS